MTAVMDGPDWHLQDAVSRLSTLIEAARVLGLEDLVRRLIEIRAAVQTARGMRP